MKNKNKCRFENFHLIPEYKRVRLSKKEIKKNIASAKKFIEVVDEELTGIEAGQTYMGQFIAHEIVGSPQNNQIRMHISPGLNLKSLYGDEYAHAFFNANGHFILGYANGSNVYGSDLLRDDNGTAMIPEFRNDENIIISQFHLLWQKIHNAIIDHLREQSAVQIQDYFNFTKNVVVTLFHKLVKEDFLKQVIMSEIYDYYFRKGTDEASSFIFANQPLQKMPIEFSRAAFRFAHSMVREHYAFSNDEDGRANSEEIFKFRSSKLPQKFIIDWDFFFQTDRFHYNYFNCAKNDGLYQEIENKLLIAIDTLIDGKISDSFKSNELQIRSKRKKRSFQLAKAIDTKIVKAMTTIPVFQTIAEENKKSSKKPEIKKIDIRDVDLAIAYKSEMATGVEILNQIDDSLEIEEILKRELIVSINKSILESFKDLKHIPLFLYVLKEAELTGVTRNPGQCKNLGCVGSFVVIETLLESMALGRSTLVNFNKEKVERFIESYIFKGKSTRFGHVINYLRKRGEL
jgi:hypothetical protein